MTKLVFFFLNEKCLFVPQPKLILRTEKKEKAENRKLDDKIISQKKLLDIRMLSWNEANYFERTFFKFRVERTIFHNEIINETNWRNCIDRKTWKNIILISQDRLGGLFTLLSTYFIFVEFMRFLIKSFITDVTMKVTKFLNYFRWSVKT